MSKSILTQLNSITESLTNPTDFMTDVPQIVVTEAVQDSPAAESLKENMEQMKVGDGFENLLDAFNLAGNTGKKIFLNLLQDNGYVTIIDPRFQYKD